MNRQEIIDKVSTGEMDIETGCDLIEFTYEEERALIKPRCIWYSDANIGRETKSIWEVTEWLSQNHSDNDAIHFYLMMAGTATHGEESNGEYYIEWYDREEA